MSNHDVQISIQPGVADKKFDDVLSAAAAELGGGDDLDGMPPLADGDDLNDMPDLADSVSEAEAKRQRPQSQASNFGNVQRAGGAGAGRGGVPAASLLVDQSMMTPEILSQLRQQMDPATMQKMREQLQQLNPAMVKQMQQSMMQMTPAQRRQMQMQMQTVAKQLPPGEFEEIQQLAKQNAQALLAAQKSGNVNAPVGMQMPTPTASAGGQAASGGSHGHSHSGGGSHGHSHGGNTNNALSFANLQRKDAAAVIKAARAELNRPFIPKSTIQYECPRCSYQTSATFPMVVGVSRCNKCGQYIALPSIDPLPRERAISSPLLQEPLQLDGVKRYMDPNLFEYVELGEFQGFKEAIMRGAQPDMRIPNDDKPNVLHWAVAHFTGDLRFIELLLRHPDIDVDDRTEKHSQTALQIAAYHGVTSVVQLLLAGGANMHLVDNSNWTVVHQAAKSGNAFLLDIFHRGGVSLQAKDQHKRTALHWAAYHNRTTSVQWLLEHGLDIMERDVEQCIPLHWAALQGHMPVIDILLRHSHTREQLDAKDETGEDASGLAADKELRVEEPERKQLYLMVAKTIRSFGSELGWRQRLCLLSRKAGGGMPPFHLDGLRAVLVAGEFASVAWFYYKNVFWLTSHLTLVTMAFNLLFIATLGVWVHARRADPGYLTQPKAAGSGRDSTTDDDDGDGNANNTNNANADRLEIVPSLPAHFGLLKRLYNESLRCVPRAYGVVDAREGVVIPSRAVRCPTADRIVLNYHGHCPWLGVPVGLRNARIVLALCALVLLLVPTWLTLGWYYVSHLTPSDESVYHVHPKLVLWLLHFGFYMYIALRNLLALANAVVLNATVHELGSPQAHPYMLVRSRDLGLAWNNPFYRGPRTHVTRFLSGADVLDVALPPRRCSAPPPTTSSSNTAPKVDVDVGGEKAAEEV